MIKATLTTAETAKIMRECGIPKDTQTLCQQIEEGFYPFAKCMNMKSNSRYFEIYKKEFAEFIAEKVGLKVTFKDPVEDYYPEPVEVIEGVFISRLEE